MATTIPTFDGWPNLPKDSNDLNTLLQWIFRNEAEWLFDALWLRYTKVAKRRCSGDSSYDDAEAWAQRDADFGNLPFAKQKRQKIPISCDVLPPLAPLPPPTSAPPSEGFDPFRTLPHDLRLEVLSYLVLPDVEVMFGRGRGLATNTLSDLALVSREWCYQVEAFCSHALLVWKQKMATDTAYWDDGLGWRDAYWVEWRRLVTFTSSARMELVVRIRNYCASRGKPTVQLSTSRLGTMWCGECPESEDWICWDVGNTERNNVRFACRRRTSRSFNGSGSARDGVQVSYTRHYLGSM